jgi:hypothetical protein
LAYDGRRDLFFITLILIIEEDDDEEKKKLYILISPYSTGTYRYIYYTKRLKSILYHWAPIAFPTSKKRLAGKKIDR